MKYKITCFLSIFLNFIGIKSIIVVPFEVSKPNKNDKLNYTFEEFFSDNFLIDFYTTIYTGNENTKVLGRISTFDHTFSFSEEECNKKSLEQNFDYSLVIKKGYPLFKSISYKNISKNNDNFIISEIFSLYNTTYQNSIPPSMPAGNFLTQNKLVDMKITIDDMNIMLDYNNTDDSINNKYCILIGLNTPYVKKDNQIYFINELKRLGVIDDYSWTLNFFSSGAGQLIIGGLPHDYMDKNEYYQKKQFIKLKSSSINDDNLPWSIIFNNIDCQITNKEKTNIQKNAKCYLVPNLGFIIGTLDYKKYILENYFKFFLQDNICIIEKSKEVKLDNIFNDEIFEVFICDKKSFEKKRIYHNFPMLYFLQKDTLNYTFSLNSFDLFYKINDKYYFLIIFPTSTLLETSKNNWYLGLLFNKYYQFIFNYDTKTLGFYAYKSEYDPEELRKEKPMQIGDMKINTKLKGYSIKRIIFEILICAILIVVAFFIGKKLNNARKKKANELKDDNYEYFSSDINSNIKANDIKSNYKEIESNSNKLMEMSSKIN